MAGKIYGQVGTFVVRSPNKTTADFFPINVNLLIVLVITGELKKSHSQGSLSFQLLCADGGLYDFGRTLCLLFIVTGPLVPRYNFIAVNKFKIDPLVLPVSSPCLLALTPLCIYCPF